MKFTTKLVLFWIMLLLSFYLAVIFITMICFHIDVSIWRMMLVFCITGVLPPMIISAFFHKRLDYMESDDLAPPSFRGQKLITLKFTPRTKSVFDEVLQKVDRFWIVSFSDRNEHVLKFRTDARVMSWGVGGYISLVDDSTLLVIVYPMNERSAREQQIVNQTVQLLKLTFKEKCCPDAEASNGEKEDIHII